MKAPTARTGKTATNPETAEVDPGADLADGAGGADGAAPPTASTSVAAARRPGRGRRVTAVVLSVLLVLLIPVTAVSVWARNQLLDTDAYLRTVGPVIAEPAVQEALGAAVTDVVMDAIDIDSRLGDDFPAVLRPLVIGAVGQIEPYVQRQAVRVMASDAVEGLWLSANRVAHEQLVRVLRGDSRFLLALQDGVVVDLTGLSGTVTARLAAAGVPIDNERLANLPIVIIDTSTLTEIQGATKAFDAVADALPWLLLVLMGAIVALVRRRAWRHIALSVALGGALLLALLAVGRTLYLGALPNDPVTLAAGAALLNNLIGALLAAGRATLAVGLVIGLVGWVADGQGRAPRALRSGVRRAAATRRSWGVPVGVGLAVLGALVLALPVPLGAAAAIALLLLVVAGSALALASRPREDDGGLSGSRDAVDETADAGA